MSMVYLTPPNGKPSVPPPLQFCIRKIGEGTYMGEALWCDSRLWLLLPLSKFWEKMWRGGRGMRQNTLHHPLTPL